MEHVTLLSFELLAPSIAIQSHVQNEPGVSVAQIAKKPVSK